MKKLVFRHRLYGAVSLAGLAAMLGVAGSSDNGGFGNTALLAAVMAVLLAITALSLWLFRLTGSALRRRRLRLARPAPSAAPAERKAA